MWGKNWGVCATLGLLISAVGSPVHAQDLVYEPVNPSFGGNPFNSGHLLAIANAQNDYEPDVEEETSQSALDRFVRSLQSRLLSSLSTQVANAIFGEDAQDEGTIVFGDQTVTFVRTLDGIQLTITNADGSSTVITIPTFQSSNDQDDDSDGDGSSSAKGSSPIGTTKLRDEFEESVRLVLNERQLEGSTLSSQGPFSAETVLLTRGDSLSRGGSLSNPSSLAANGQSPIQ